MSRGPCAVLSLCVVAFVASSASAAIYDRGHGMIYDSVSGCTWLKDVMYVRTAGLDADGLVSRDWAQSFCNNLVHGGFDDWIMPRVFEGSYGSDFYNLIDWSLGNDSPYLTNPGPFRNFTSPAQRFWSRGTDGWSSQTWYYSLAEYGLKVDNYGSNIIWPCRPGDVGTLPSNYDHTLIGGGFAQGFTGWDVVGLGTASIYNYGGNDVAKLVTGSPITLKQFLDTPAESFILEYEYEFPSLAGTLSVYLGGSLIDTLECWEAQPGQMVKRTRNITSPSLLGLTSAELAFKFDNYSSGAVLYLDDIALVPEPATLGLFGLASLFLLRSRRRG